MKASAIPAIPSFNRLPVGPNEYQAYKAHSSWKHIRGLCAFFAFFGGDVLRNQAFQARTETGKRRKLEVVLRQLTGDHLTDQQRQLISQTVGCCQQYSFQLCYEPGAPALTANGDGQAAVYRIFGDTAKGPTAVLVRTPGQGEMSNTIYIYLPTQREEKGDDTRQEETSAQ